MHHPVFGIIFLPLTSFIICHHHHHTIHHFDLSLPFQPSNSRLKMTETIDPLRRGVEKMVFQGFVFYGLKKTKNLERSDFKMFF